MTNAWRALLFIAPALVAPALALPHAGAAPDDAPDVTVLKGHDLTVFAVAYTPDGEALVSGSADGSVKIWDLASRKAERTLTIGDDMVRVVAISSDGESIAAGDDVGKIRIWNAATGKLVRTVEGHAGEIRGLSSGTARQESSSGR